MLNLVGHSLIYFLVCYSHARYFVTQLTFFFIHFIDPSTSNISSVDAADIQQDENAMMNGDESATVSLESTDIEDVVSNILSSEFSEVYTFSFTYAFSWQLGIMYVSS